MEKPGHAPSQIDSKACWPSFGWIAVTSRCNLNCTHCQRGMLKERGLLTPSEMSLKVFNRLESEVFPHLKKLQFGGNNFGEQLSASNWDTFFERVSKRNIDISIVSNSMLLNTARIKAMVEAGVEFNFSLEGVSRESYEAVRGHGYDKFFDIISETCRIKNTRQENGSLVSLGYTVFRDNIMETPELIKKAAQIGVDRVIVTHFSPWEENQRKQCLVYHKELSNQVLDKARILAGELGIIVYFPKPFHTSDRSDTPPSQAGLHQKQCLHPWKSFSINEKGDVMPCCATSVVMGNLETTSFYDIWNGRKYKKLRRTVNSSRPLVFCRDCAFREIEAGSAEPISFWSDEQFLLAAIGTEKPKDSSSLTLHKIKTQLRNSRWGNRALPYLMEFYRRNGAFYVTDIHDNLLTPLGRMFTRKR